MLEMIEPKGEALEKQGVPDRKMHQVQPWRLSVMELKQRAAAAAAAQREERLRSLTLRSLTLYIYIWSTYS